VTRSGCLLLAALAGSTGCLLFTDDINHLPTVELSGPDMVSRGDSARFDALAADEDQGEDSLTLEWRSRPAPCPPSGTGMEVEPAMAGPVPANRTYVLQNVTDPTCVWVVARDERGAQASKAKVVAPNHLPQAVIDVVKGKMAGDAFELYGVVQLTGTHSTDEDRDVVTVAGWSMTTPDGKTRTPDVCPSAKDDVCVSLDRPGPTTFELTVRDSRGGQGQGKRTLMVAEDRPPCIETTMPDFRIGTFPHQSNAPLRFELNVASDDGDPYPAAAELAKLTWEWRFEGDPDWSRQTMAFQYSVLDFPPKDLALHAGRPLTVRFTYQDRVMRDLSRCAEGSCELVPPAAGAHCYQRVSWTAVIF
jgi:hypothetical protein